MNKYNHEYYIAEMPFGENHLYIGPDQKTADRAYHYEKVPLGETPFFFRNSYEYRDKTEGKKRPVTEILMDGGDLLVSGEIRRFLMNFDIKGMQIYPSVYIDDDNNWHEDYWFLTFYKSFKYWDKKQSVSEMEDHAELIRYSLDAAKLDKIPEEHRLLFKMKGVNLPYVIVHQKIVDFIVDNNYPGIRFFRISDFEEGMQYWESHRAKAVEAAANSVFYMENDQKHSDDEMKTEQNEKCTFNVNTTEHEITVIFHEENEEIYGDVIDLILRYMPLFEDSYEVDLQFRFTEEKPYLRGGLPKISVNQFFCDAVQYESLQNKLIDFFNLVKTKEFWYKGLSEDECTGLGMFVSSALALHDKAYLPVLKEWFENLDFEHHQTQPLILEALYETYKDDLPEIGMDILRLSLEQNLYYDFPRSVSEQIRSNSKHLDMLFKVLDEHEKTAPYEVDIQEYFGNFLSGTVIEQRDMLSEGLMKAYGIFQNKNGPASEVKLLQEAYHHDKPNEHRAVQYAQELSKSLSDLQNRIAGLKITDVPFNTLKTIAKQGEELETLAEQWGKNRTIVLLCLSGLLIALKNNIRRKHIKEAGEQQERILQLVTLCHHEFEAEKLYMEGAVALFGHHISKAKVKKSENQLEKIRNFIDSSNNGDQLEAIWISEGIELLDLYYNYGKWKKAEKHLKKLHSLLQNHIAFLSKKYVNSAMDLSKAFIAEKKFDRAAALLYQLHGLMVLYKTKKKTSTHILSIYTGHLEVLFKIYLEDSGRMDDARTQCRRYGEADGWFKKSPFVDYTYMRMINLLAKHILPIAQSIDKNEGLSRNLYNFLDKHLDLIQEYYSLKKSDCMQLSGELTYLNFKNYLNTFLMAAFELGEIKKGVEIADAIQEMAPINNHIYHSAACLYVADGQFDKALRQVELAKEHKYPYMESVQNDADLELLFEEKRFKSVFS